jgi:hypothetical protein
LQEDLTPTFRVAVTREKNANLRPNARLGYGDCTFFSRWIFVFPRREKIMDCRKKADDARRDDRGKKFETEGNQPLSSPATDPTNPHNPEPTGHWVANERASDRRNSEPGMTDHERKRRNY